jgi:glycosyltransferase involved in cell wall biosynthesis
VVPIYSAIDLLASASLGEGFSNVIGEAMSCGIPCVVTNVGDSARIVQNTGLVVKPGDADELANAMLHSFDKENRAELKPVLRTCIKEKFSISAMTAATIDALHTLCKEGLWTS